MRINIVGLHAPNAPRLRSLLGPEHEVLAWDGFPATGDMEADVIISNSVSPHEAARLRCQLVHVPGAGAEQVAMHALRPGTAVCNVFGHEVPIAEFTLHAMLEHSLALWKYPQCMDAAAWAQAYGKREQHGEVFGTTAVVLGFGHIGQEIARRARAFGVHVIAVTRSGKAGPAELAAEYVSAADFHAVLPRAHTLVVCCPLDDSTRAMIGKRELALLPPRCFADQCSAGRSDR